MHQPIIKHDLLHIDNSNQSEGRKGNEEVNRQTEEVNLFKSKNV